MLFLTPFLVGRVPLCSLLKWTTEKRKGARIPISLEDLDLDMEAEVPGTWHVPDIMGRPPFKNHGLQTSRDFFRLEPFWATEKASSHWLQASKFGFCAMGGARRTRICLTICLKHPSLGFVMVCPIDAF